MVKVIVITLVLALCLGGQAVAVQTWDLFSQFSSTTNPNEAWTNGYSIALDSYAFSAFDWAYSMTVFNSDSEDWSNCHGWGISGTTSFLPSLWVNPTDIQHGWMPAQTCASHPGWGDSAGPGYSVIRWTAPSAGTYRVDMRVYGGPSVSFSSLDMHVLLNNTEIPEASQLCGVAYERDGVYSAELNLAANTTVDLAVGCDGVCNADAFLLSCAVSEVVPEPGSLAAMATGLVGLAGLALRRRS